MEDINEPKFDFDDENYLREFFSLFLDNLVNQNIPEGFINEDE